MEILQVNEDQQKKLATVLKNFRIQLFEYIVDEDKLVVYEDRKSTRLNSSHSV